MDRNYIEQHFLVDRYIQGKLEESDRDAFEERLVWDTALVEEVELAERLRVGLQDASAAKADIVDAPGFDLLAALSGFFAVPQFAAAAAFLVAMALTIGVMRSPVVDTGGGSAPGAQQTDIVPLFATRSDNVISIAVDPDAWTVLLVDVMGDYPSYRVTVRRDETGSDPVWVQDGLLPTYPESLAVGMPGSTLAAGRYVLTIEGALPPDTGDTLYEPVQNIPFIATPAD
jgi:hypothetical protein